MMEMKKFAFRVSFIAAAVFALLIMMTLFADHSVFAGEYNLKYEVKEGEANSVDWGSTYDSDAVTYAEIKTSKKGYISFTADFSCYVSLCNANKKVISRGSASDGVYVNGSSDYTYMRTACFGVAKGKTYYIRIKGMPYSTDSSGNYVGVIEWNGKKIKPAKFGKKKTKARAIKRKKTVKGLFVAGNKKAQWFKITNKKTSTKITIASAKNCDSFKITAYYKSYGKWYTSTHYVYRSSPKNVLTGTVSRKVKHTYYLKVQPMYKTSGYYTIKWA